MFGGVGNSNALEARIEEEMIAIGEQQWKTNDHIRKQNELKLAQQQATLQRTQQLTNAGNVTALAQQEAIQAQKIKEFQATKQGRENQQRIYNSISGLKNIDSDSLGSLGIIAQKRAGNLIGRAPNGKEFAIPWDGTNEAAKRRNLIRALGGQDNELIIDDAPLNRKKPSPLKRDPDKKKSWWGRAKDAVRNFYTDVEIAENNQKGILEGGRVNLDLDSYGSEPTLRDDIATGLGKGAHYLGIDLPELSEEEIPRAKEDTRSGWEKAGYIKDKDGNMVKQKPIPFSWDPTQKK